ncbi:MAG: primosomal protein N' [Tatlockia sp.]|nr:primosomal protein N' [Tatlockia sp.]
MKTIYKVCVLHTNRDYFDYSSGELSPEIGARVWVPFRNKTRLGVVISKEEAEFEPNKLKDLSEIIDKQALLSETLLNLCHWVSTYYHSALSEVIPLALPKKYRQGAEVTRPLCDYFELALTQENAKKLISPRAKKQQALIEFLSESDKPIQKASLLEAGFSQAQLTTLCAQGLIALSQRKILPITPKQLVDKALELNDEQAYAVNTISGHLESYHCFLLQGVTGSGKTEVYLQLITKVLAAGRQVLILVPEIGLTPQLLARFSARFQEPIAVIHSSLNESERQTAWQLANDQEVRLVIGTRAAVFTPMPSLGLIVIDEEHDTSLKQMEGVRYSARDTALMRAYLAKIPIILGSATPSLESLHNCAQSKYNLIRLRQKALNTTALHYQLIDIRSVNLQQGLAASCLNAISEHLAKGNQVLVFINRRGFAPVLLCHQCGWMADCKSCDSHMTMHRKTGRLICHHCGLMKPVPVICQSCSGKELLPIGSGTQRIHEYLQTQFPNTNLLRIDRDEIRTKNALNDHLETINKGEAQLIVGTQMLAKGHHFPRLSLVVVLDSDAGFYNQDFRALERLGQLLTQVAGRAGRANHPGQVLIQTHIPDNPLLNLLIQHGYEGFAKALLIMREQAELPPFHFLAVIRAQDKIPAKVLKFLHLSKEQLEAEGIRVLGPAPAPLARKADQHRMQLLVKSASRKMLHNSLTKLRNWLTLNKLATNVRWNVDVDPMDLS